MILYRTNIIYKIFEQGMTKLKKIKETNNNNDNIYAFFFFQILLKKGFNELSNNSKFSELQLLTNVIVSFAFEPDKLIKLFI